jgi:hypothetical protein
MDSNSIGGTNYQHQIQLRILPIISICFFFIYNVDSRVEEYTVMKSKTILLKLSVFLIVISLLLTGCIKVVLKEPGQTGAAPVINSFTANPFFIQQGDSSELSWNVSGADTVSINQGIGEVDAQGGISVSPGTDTGYILTATNNGNGSVTALVNITVEESSQSPAVYNTPVINSFTAEPGIIYYGGSSILSWDVSGADSVNISPSIGDVSGSGSAVVKPVNNVTFTLTASNSYGDAMATMQVMVTESNTMTIYTGLPVIQYFNAEPLSIENGEYTIISWNVSNADAVIVNPDIGAVPVSGSVQISPQQTTFFVIQAINSNGMADDSLTITVSDNFDDMLALNWSGDYDTNWGRMHVEQSGNTVTGTYTHDEGRIEGTISPDSQYVIIGRWLESPSYAPPSDGGDVYLSMTRDHSSFSGKWRYGFTGDYGVTGDWDGTWSGTRITP